MAQQDPTEFVHTPAWVRDAVFYQVFPDRFALDPDLPKPSNLEPWESPPTPHGFKGGDLLGVINHLDYLRELGVSAIYLTPIFCSPANHRYHTHDYFNVDPMLGGNEALDLLLRRAHNRGMKIVLDGVFNHVGRGFFQFNNLLENGRQSPYLDWFHLTSWPLHPYGSPDQPPGYDCWWNNRDLPELATETPAVRAFVWEVAEYWIKRGIDGWRLDVPNEIDDDDFWREFRFRVKALNPDAYIVGEIWDDARRWLTGDQFDGVQNYLFTKACLGFFTAGTGTIETSAIEGTGLDPINALDAAGFRDSIDSVQSLYPWPITLSQLNQLDSHDTARYLTMSGDDESAFRLAILFQMTYPGAPCIYYGDEVGMSGGRDPDCRRGFPWTESLWNRELLDYVRQCVALRRSSAVFRHGTYASLYARDDVYVFARVMSGEFALVALNAAREPRNIRLERSTEMPLKTVRNAWSEQLPTLVDGELGIGPWRRDPGQW